MSAGHVVGSTLGGTSSGAASGGSLGGGWGALIGGLLGGAGGLASGLLGSGGSSAAQMLDSLEKYYQPTQAGWSWAQMENQVAIDQFRKQLQSSANADLELSKFMNLFMPSYQVQGLKDAGLNPILAVLGSGFSPISASASASGVGGAHLPSGFTSSSRRVNSAGSAADFARILGGAIDAEVSNRRADTDNKQALTGNIKKQNELIDAQADNLRAQSEGIRDKIDHGSSWYSDFGREARSGISPIIEGIVGKALDLFGFGSPEAVKPDKVSSNAGHSAKDPGLTLEVNLEPKKSYNPERKQKGLPTPSLMYIPAGL